MKQRRYGWVAATFMACLVGRPAGAASIPIPNGSFESPEVLYVGLLIDSWHKTPQPEGYDPELEGPWNEKVGVFLNTPVGSDDHIDNIDGAQAIWIFANAGAGVFQDSLPLEPNQAEPSQVVEATFEPGKAYRLTAGFIGGGFAMEEGTSLELAMYYRDSQSNAVVVASTTVVHDLDTFPNGNHFVDFHAETAEVQPDDPWAGQTIGVRILSVVPQTVQGYWDVDHVRLTVIEPSSIAAPSFDGQAFQFNVVGDPGEVLDVLAADELTLPLTEWTTIGTVTNQSGVTLFSDPGPATNRRFYRLRQAPQ